MSSPPTRFVLRDLPGVEGIEALLEAASRHPNRLWSREYEQAKALVFPTSRRLFGITEDETRFVDDPALSPRGNDVERLVWEQEFDFIWQEEDEAEIAAIWLRLGWDLSDSHGEPLHCASFFYRQMVAVALGMAGHPPGQPVELNQQQQREVEAKLQADRDKFRRGRR